MTLPGWGRKVLLLAIIPVPQLGMSRLFFPTSKQKQSLKKLTILPRETTESLDYTSYSDGG